MVTSKISPAPVETDQENQLRQRKGGNQDDSKSKEPDAAARTIQAAHRGKKDRHEVKEKRAGKVSSKMRNMSKKFKLSSAHKLITDPHTRKMSMRSVMIACFVDCCCSTILAPNYNFMCTPNVHRDSFPDTKPFDLATAINFVPASGAFGKIIASAVAVRVSNKIGRKPTMILCLVGGCCGCILKYFLRATFWGFCIGNFVNGLFAASIVVGLAYNNDVYDDEPAKKAENMNALIGTMIMGGSVGNLVAIALEDVGLFEGLIVGAGMSLLAAFALAMYMVEADKNEKADASKGDKFKQDDQHEHVDEGEKGPQKANKKLLFQIIFGSLADQLGSAGPPLMLQIVFYKAYYVLPLYSGETPTVTASEFKWIDTATMFCFFGTLAISMPFQKIFGPSGTCVIGNFITAIFCFVLYQMASGPTPSNPMKIGFVTVYYLSQVVGTLSMVTTMPMIDAITPKLERADAQALNQVFTDLSEAVTPLMFSAILDASGSETMMWFTVACSIFATLVNLPLLKHKALGAKAFADMMDSEKPQAHPEPDLKEDGDGWMSIRDLEHMNLERLKRGEQPLKLKYGEYDPTTLRKIKSRALVDFSEMKDMMGEYLYMIRTPEERKNMIAMIELSKSDQAHHKKVEEECGRWFMSYLKDVGYDVSDNPTMWKMILMTNFPPILPPGSGGKYTVDNLRPSLLKGLKLNQQWLAAEQSNRATSLAAFSKTGMAVGI